MAAERRPIVDAHGQELTHLSRELLVERLDLEKKLYSGLRMVLLCGGLFISLISTLNVQINKDAQFALHQSYQDTFDLLDAENIITPFQLREHLSVFSQQVRTLQVLSSDFFVEKEGELKVLGGIKLFTEPQVLEVKELMPRIDTESFSFMAWVQRDSPDLGGFILRKPLGTGSQRIWSCYAWHIANSPSLAFGAHDVGLPDYGIMEERVVADGEWALDDAFHLEMMVVNRTSISFYRDAQLVSVLPLRRPVTDCSGSTFLVGDTGLRLAEITFYARSLSETEIQEIFFAGFTFESIATGKIPYQPQETDFDRLLGAQAESVSTLLTAQDEALRQAAVGRVLTQALIQQLQENTQAVTPTVTLPPDAGCASEWPPCRKIRNVSQTLTTDPFTGKQYYELVPAAARSGASAQARLSVPLVPRQQMMQYDAESFPTWAGQSASFSVWIRPNAEGYVLAKSPDAVQNTMCWSLFVSESWGIGTQGDAPSADGTWIHPTNTIRWGGSLESRGSTRPPITDRAKKLRHVAFIFDKDTNSLRAYVDGTLVADQPFLEADTVGRLDCPVTSDTFISFAHRAPGGLPFTGDIQDFRLYVGTALTAEEVKGLSDGEGSEAVRECSLESEGQDTNYEDMNGNTCAWYQEVQSEAPAVCTAASVRTECPVACGTQEPCFEPPAPPAPTFQIWEKIMRLEPRLEGVGSLCVREGVDALGECMAAAARRDPLSFPPNGEAWTDKYTSLVEGGLGEPNITNCMILGALLEPSCSFKVPGEWTKSFDAAAQASREWTVSFWYKSGKSPEQIGAGIDLWMTFYSSIAPPIPAIRIVGYSGILLFQTWGRPNCGPGWSENVNMQASFQPAGEWVHIALVFGAPRGPEGQRTLTLVKDSSFVVDLLNREWCPPATGEFIQGLTVMHGHETLLSPILVTPQARSIKALQLRYYQHRPAFRLRRGPSLPETTRHSRPVTYQRVKFDGAGALLAPPILLQRRLRSTEDCEYSSGKEFTDKIWRDAVDGMTCGPPYLCSEELLASPSDLLTCRGSEMSSSFLGRSPLTVRGEKVFAEFLPSIADASILVREGELFETAKFIDLETDEISVSVVLFAPNVGVLTLITVRSILASRVNVEYTIEHFQAVEGDVLRDVMGPVAATFVFVFFSVVELVIEGITSWREKEQRHLKLVILDFLILVIVPIVFLSMRVGQLQKSASIMSKVIGEDGLGGVPWASTDIPLDAKMAAFFEGLEELQEHFVGEQRMRVLAFTSAMLLLLRVILATKAHPRTAVLVTTIEKAADDLWHFILLFLVLFLGFGGVAYVSFGSQKFEFYTMSKTFESLFEMMLGSLPKAGGRQRESWTDDPLLIIFVTLFNFFVFFVMLNFIIAIIVEAYLSTKRMLEDQLTEQEFIHDIIDSLRSVVRRLMYRWPAHVTIITALESIEDESFNHLDEDNLCTIFPTWDRASIQKFVAHYFEFHFLRPEEIENMIKLEGPELVNEIEHRVHHLIKGGHPVSAARTRNSLVLGKGGADRTESPSVEGGGIPSGHNGPSYAGQNQQGGALSQTGSVRTDSGAILMPSQPAAQVPQTPLALSQYPVFPPRSISPIPLQPHPGPWATAGYWSGGA